MSVAPVTPAPAAKLERVPKVRMAMHLFVPGSGKETRVTVTELMGHVRLEIDQDNSGLGVKHVDLSIPEAIKLADLLNLIRNRVVKRPEYRP